MTGKTLRGRPWAEIAAEAPAPRRQCDGVWLAPTWCPDTKRWEMQPFDTGLVRLGKTREECGDPECAALHLDEVSPAEVAKMRGHQRQAVA